MVGIISKCYKKRQKEKEPCNVHRTVALSPSKVTNADIQTARNASRAGAERLCPGNQSGEGAALPNVSVLREQVP